MLGLKKEFEGLSNCWQLQAKYQWQVEDPRETLRFASQREDSEYWRWWPHPHKQLGWVSKPSRMFRCFRWVFPRIIETEVRKRIEKELTLLIKERESGTVTTPKSSWLSKIPVETLFSDVEKNERRKERCTARYAKNLSEEWKIISETRGNFFWMTV